MHTLHVPSSNLSFLQTRSTCNRTSTPAEDDTMGETATSTNQRQSKILTLDSVNDDVCSYLCEKTRRAETLIQTLPWLNEMCDCVQAVRHVQLAHVRCHEKRLEDEHSHRDRERKVHHFCVKSQKSQPDETIIVVAQL